MFCVCYMSGSMNDYYGFFFVLNWDLLSIDVVWAYCGAISVLRFVAVALSIHVWLRCYRLT